MEEQADQAVETVRVAIEEAINLLTAYGLDVIGAILILIIGFWAARRVHGGVSRSLEKTGKIDLTLNKFFASMARYLVLIVTIMAVLNQFGIETTSLVAVVGAAGLAIGLALQGTLSNVAAGVMLLIFRPFKVGDFVEAAGHAGSVKELNLFVTEMATGDNIRIIVPNGKIWGDSIRNFSSNPTRRVDLVMGIGYDDDIDKAMEVMHEVIAEDDRVLKDPEPFIAVSELADSSVNFVVRAWVNSGDYWPVKFGLTRAIKLRFDEKGINIPYPHRTVYLHKED